MKHTRLASPILTTAITMSVAAVSLTIAPAASASQPEFKPGTLNIARGESGTVALQPEGIKPITCLSSTSTGEITGPKTVGGLVVTFHSCSSREGTGCSLKSSGDGAGLITTNTIDGELGLVNKAEAASGVGLLFLPTSGTTFVTLEGPCLIASPSPVTGSVAAEVTPVGGPASKDGRVIFEGDGKEAGQKIKEINVLGTLLKPTLKALGLLPASQTGVGLSLFANDVEVT